LGRSAIVAVMRHTLFVAIALALSSSASSQEDGLPAVAHPVLPTVVRQAKDFVPSGWKLVAIKTGELSGDEQADVAVLMRMTDPKNIAPADSRYYKFDDTNPYLLAIGFARRGGFDLVASNDKLFPREVAPMHGDDPPSGRTVDIKRGVLTLQFGHLRGFDQLRFRWNGKAFSLIGYDCAGVAGDTLYSLSANYLTRKARIGKGEATSGPDVVSIVGIRAGKRPTLDDIDWESEWTGTDNRGRPLAC
jgi:hypothetical protein